MTQGASESIVGAAFALYFDETSGDLHDAVGGVTLTKVTSATPTYGVNAASQTPDVSGYNPGVTIPSTSPQGWKKLTATPSFVIGATDDLRDVN